MTRSDPPTTRPPSTTRFALNGRAVELQADATMPLLWALRDHLGLKGTKPGCLQGVCGACTVHVDGAPARACQLPLSAVAGRTVTTIEGLPAHTQARLQAGWAAHQALQCGWCQPGQAMTAASLLAQPVAPDAAGVAAAMAGHLCRCGTGHRVVRAVLAALANPAPPARSTR
ncbi:MAG: 2Fe-2S iron-sulfur cluster binding domain-containing protein [Burkholderiales bacterium]|nr:2Fe-2S iron-sulfur cluster binding domain-containing protein [Burkholderiales bacterium]